MPREDPPEEALERDRVLLRTRLEEAFARPELRDALFVASTELDDAFEVWRREPTSARGQRIERALTRYFARTCGRPTPFGLFAGCSTGTVGPRTRIELEARESYRRHSRLDMDYLDRLTRALANDPSVADRITYCPNSSLYRATGRLRYVESRFEDDRRTHRLTAVKETTGLTKVLDRAAAGASRTELVRALTDDSVSAVKADAFVREVIESQILVPELALAITGLEPLGPLIDDLRSVGATYVADRLDRVGAELESIDAANLGAAGERYRAIAHSLEDLPATPESRRLFQVDLVKPELVAVLGRPVVREIERGVELLRRLARRRDPDELAQFREAFLQRYEGREVPLVEALDAEAGIGWSQSGSATGDAAPLLRGLAFPRGSDGKVDWGPREDFLLGKLGEAAQLGLEQIALEAGDLKRLAVEEPPTLPDAFAAVVRVAAHSQDGLDRGDFRLLLQGLDGPSGARFLGRFCHADERLRDRVREHLRAEEALDPEAVYAEIVHLPDGRIGNVVLRPLVRDHEIPYLGRSGVPADSQIGITDLFVSVQGDRIVLRSAQLGRRIVPRLSSAHRFRLSPLPIYRFLCLLQGQGAAGIGWDWMPFHAERFLPRITAGRVVLALSRWRLGEEELENLSHASFREVLEWRAERRLPRLVALLEGDRALPVDLDNVLSVESFVHLLRGRDTAVLEEVFPPPDELLVRGPEGAFMHELVVPFVASTPGPASVAEIDRQVAPGQRGFRRSFPPGSAWLYAKLYTGSSTTDLLLRDEIAPLARQAIASAAADSWFFIRYGDPDWHVRLRFHGRLRELASTVGPAVGACASRLLTDGLIWRYQLDTYEREVERYGGPRGIELAESIFHADSDAVLGLLEALPLGDAGPDARWLFALQGVTSLLSDLALDEAASLRVLERVRENFRREFRADARLKRQLGERFRKERERVEATVEGPRHAAFAERSDRLEPLVSTLRRLDRAGKLSRPVEEIAESYVHMHVNRMLRSAQRAHELVLYDFLTRVYKSRAARVRGAGT